MTTIVLLLALGIVLLALEVFLPGGIVGAIGGVLMAGGCVLAFVRFGASGGSLATAVALLALGVALYVEFAWLPKTRWGGKLFLHRAVDATSQPPLADAAQVVGKVGEAFTMLAPSGYVMLEGRRYQGCSQSGLIAKGAAVRVVRVDNFQLIVSQL